MNRDIAELEERFQQLRRMGSALATEMRAVAETLTITGLTDQCDLEKSLDSYQSQWTDLCDDLSLPSEAAANGNHLNWDSFRGRLAEFREAGEALARLEIVNQLTTPSGSESLLDPVHSSCREIMDRILKCPWAETDLIRDIRSGCHPLSRLTSLVTSLQDLTDDQWTAEMNSMQELFGAALTTLLARGKLTLSTNSV